MLFKAFKQAWGLMKEKRALFIPSIVLVVISYLLSQFSLNVLTSLLFNFSTVQLTGTADILQFPLLFYQTFAETLNATIVLALVAFFVQVFILFWVTKIISSREKKALGNSLKETIQHIPQIIALFIFLGLIGVIYLQLLLWALWFIPMNGIVAFILTAILLIVGIYLFIHFLMLIPAMAKENLKVGQAFREAWEFGNKHWLGLLGVLIITAVVSFIFSQILAFISLQSISEEVLLVIGIVLSLIYLTFANNFFAAYYLQESK